jgi:hypothetical protein
MVQLQKFTKIYKITITHPSLQDSACTTIGKNARKSNFSRHSSTQLFTTIPQNKLQGHIKQLFRISSIWYRSQPILQSMWYHKQCFPSYGYKASWLQISILQHYAPCPENTKSNNIWAQKTGLWTLSTQYHRSLMEQLCKIYVAVNANLQFNSYIINSQSIHTIHYN